ncbi:tyrosine-protein phosphatase non-receptor type 23 isoform X1 [Polistes fuscatus]|uniref:tyrosine-protein phosphatase non-receptor type 23 isoform X1 n=1 Tax=Polistes fuscatus TaxID=30207 RepID=UPI001CA7DE81|nr:tyrosine-protein phosphatase non-receptor type 23 isoform X1 [Polistes fuscatus]
MEAVPRLPMISFYLKVSPEPITFGPKLKQYIRDFYNEDPESYTNEIHQLESLRTMAVRPPLDMAGCLLLKKYYCQLHFLQSRFPMGKDGGAAITFTWRDTYANMVCSLASIRFEIISILYNIGAMHTQLGARTERTTADGMKMACAHFQCAAWAFEHLKNSFPQPSGVDLAPELMTFMYQLCLAQAQECILEKSMLDNRKPTIVAKVARQIVDYYTSTLSTLEQGGSEEGTISDTVGTKIYKSWKRYVKFKRAYHLAVTHLYQGLAAEEQRKMGERVAFYNAALASLNEAHLIYSFAKGSVDVTGAPDEKAVVEEALTFTNDVIEGKRKAAKNENEFIYHEEIPEKETLTVIKGASLVKGISFSINDPEVSGPDIFARLVPMKVHEASSLYSEEKAKILRNVGSKIEDKDFQLNTFLSSFKLDHLDLWDPDVQASEWELLPLPEELIERCAALNAKKEIIQDLLDIMGKLTDTSQDVETVLKEIKKLLFEEELKEKQYQDAVGKRPPTIVATDLTRECKKYEEAHNKALESNQALHKAITMHVKNLKILAQPLPDLIVNVPSLSTHLSDQSSDTTQSIKIADKLHVQELKRILNKVDEMRRQRSDLHSKLRDSIAQDDLTRLLVTATSESSSLDRLFSEQLSKHQSLVSLIEQNLSAQENIMAALTDAYAQTGDVRKIVEDVLKRREFMISSLIASYDAYEDLLTKANKGLEFYRKLEINVSKLLQRVKSTCKVQEEEREQILAQDNKNVYNKTETSTLTNYEHGQTRSTSGLKLKDYLNNRLDSISTLSNQYYNPHKGIAGPSQMDILPTTKSYLNNIVDTHSQPISTVPVQEIQASNMKLTQQYHPSMYVDPRTASHYAYKSRTSTENQDMNATINQSYVASKKDETAKMYHQISTTTDVTSNLPYSTTYLPNEQGYCTQLPDVQNKFPSTSMQHYSQNNTMHYNTYPISVEHGEAITSQDPNLINRYGPNQDKANMMVPTEGTIVSQMQSVSLTGHPVSSTTINSTRTLNQSQMSQNIVHPEQQYVPKDVTKSVTSSEPSHTMYRQNQNIISAQSNTAIQNYAYSHVNQNNMPYVQNYSTIGYNQQTPSHNTTDYVASMPYVQVQQSNTAVQSTQPSTSVTPASNINEVPVSYSSDLQNPAAVQYNQQNYTNQQMPLNYPNNYQNLYHATTGLSYPQNQAVSTMSNNYPYMNYTSSSELIQSHTKATTVQSYSQPYDYSHQVHYTDYSQNPNYAQHYNQGYSYMHANHAVNTAAISYQTESLKNVYQAQESNARYTNASNNTMTQTPSSQYSNQDYQSELSNDIYYTTPYGLQMQGQGGTSTRVENNYNQTYMQAVNNGTNTTTSSNPVKPTTKSEEQKSNVDLLSDLDITINHAPLVPEVRPLNKAQDDDDAASIKSTDKKEEKEDEPKQEVTHISEKTSTYMENKEDYESLQIVWDTWYTDVQPKKDPLGNPETMQKFINEVEKYEKFVDSLLVKTLSGATNLDIKWKEVQDFEERESAKQSSTIALANSLDNRVTDCIPYDITRVQISSPDVSSSYINASHVVEITQWTPTAFIITQAPLPDKIHVFWTMIWEQECEVIACLVSDAQLKQELYWSVDTDNDFTIGNFVIKTKKTVTHTFYIQRVLSLCNTKTKSEKIVVHMQFLVWPSNGFPSSPGALLTFATDVMTEQALRRCSPKPIVVHCVSGGSLSGLFLVAASTVCHIRAGRGIADVPLVFKGLVKCRKQVVNKESLLFAYRMVLYHAQDILMKQHGYMTGGILSSTRSTFEGFESLKLNKEKSIRKTHPSDDFLHNLSVGGHSETKQRADAQVASTHSNTIQSIATDKTNEAFIDPLSQLDPLWSIRR